MLFSSLKNNRLFLPLFFLGVAYAYGVLSAAHYGMFGNDFYLSLAVSTIASFGVFFGIRNVTIERLGFSTLSWLFLAILIAIQPLIHNVHYVDALVFPFGVLVISTLLSIFVVNLSDDDKKRVTHYIAWLFLISGILSVGTQFVQLIYPNSFGDFIAPISQLNRLYGNISQPNTASFINVLAIVSAFYLLFLSDGKKTHTALIISFVLLVIGITFTLSRAGILLLGVAILTSIFYPWSSHKFRSVLLTAGFLLSILAYQSGMWLMQSHSSIYQGSSGIERLMSEGTNLRLVLLERAWSAFLSNPIFGVGYDNYYAHSVQEIERYAWFETADHAHNVIAQIGAEFGILGLLIMVGILIVLFAKVIQFFKAKLPPHELFVCLLLLIFVLYSLSEFPLWYPKFLLPFVMLVGMLDAGFALKKKNIKKPLIVLTLIASVISATYTVIYQRYLQYYEIVVFAPVDNQQKIDAYQSFPNIIGFKKSKDYMLHMVVDVEDSNNAMRLIELGDRLMRAIPGMDIARIQTDLLMKTGSQLEADKLNRRLCIWEYQQVKHCNQMKSQILKLDPEDNMGYAKRLDDWYQLWYPTREVKN